MSMVRRRHEAGFQQAINTILRRINHEQIRQSATRRVSPSSLPGPGSQKGATDLPTSDDIARHGHLKGLPPTEGRKPNAQTRNTCALSQWSPLRRVQTGRKSRNHLSDVYTGRFTYNCEDYDYGSVFESALPTHHSPHVRGAQTGRLG
jgi:hypothetical protein